MASETDSNCSGPNTPASIDTLLADRNRQLELRERELQLREARMIQASRTIPTADSSVPLRLRVGHRVFHTTPAVLFGKQGQQSFFAALLEEHSRVRAAAAPPKRKFSFFSLEEGKAQFT